MPFAESSSLADVVGIDSNCITKKDLLLERIAFLLKESTTDWLMLTWVATSPFLSAIKKSDFFWAETILAKKREATSSRYWFIFMDIVRTLKIIQIPVRARVSAGLFSL